MKDFLRTFVMAGLPFGILMGLFFSLLNGVPSGILSGVFSGILFGLLLAAFVAFQSRKAKKDPPVFAGEELIKDGGANHFVGYEGVGGWAFLTDRQFYFKSHSANVNVHEISIPIAQISEAKRGRSLGIIPNQLHLHLADGRVEKFVVHGVNDWLAETGSARQKFLNAPKPADRIQSLEQDA